MHLLDVIFPKRCVGCGRVGKYFCLQCIFLIKPIGQHETICPVCAKPSMGGFTHRMCKARFSMDGLTSFFHYRGVVQKAVKSMKYRFVSDLAKEFVGLIPSFCVSQFVNHNSYFLIPIPLHPSRERFRGFNQAEVLGTLLAQRFSIPMQNNLLKRMRETTSQVEVKDREKRLKNMDGVFALQPNFDKSMLKHKFVNGKEMRIFLFDDVWTTGATMRSAANVLKRAGARFVWGVTIAR